MSTTSTTSLRHPLNVLALSGSGKLLAVAYSNRVQVVEVSSGKLLATSASQDSHSSQTLVRHLVWHQDDKLVSSGDDKVVKEWSVQRSASEGGAVTLTLDEQRELPKRPNAISITSDGNTLVVGDKFGDVYAFAMHGCTSDLPAPPVPSFPESSTAGAEGSTSSKAEPKKEKDPNQRRGQAKNPEWRHVPARVSTLTPVVGHVSMLTSMLLLDGAQHQQDGQSRIITADRDEHIRVSKWPQGWEIEEYLLGQKKFVSALALLPSDPTILLSAGGDEHLRMWSLKDYQCLSKDAISLAPLKDTAAITVEIERAYGKRRALKTAGAKKQKGNKKAKFENGNRNGKADGNAPDAAATATPDAEADAEVDQQDKAEDEEAAAWKPTLKTKKLDIAIRKMVFVGCEAAGGSSGNGVLVLLSVSSSALLVYPVSALMEAPVDPASRPHQLITFSRPVLDMVGAADGQGLWVSLDLSAEAKADASIEAAVRAIHCFKLSSDNKLERAEHASVPTLNDECSEVATEESPFPGSTALYPDVALLSKDSVERGGDGAGAGDESVLAEDDEQ